MAPALLPCPALYSPSLRLSRVAFADCSHLHTCVVLRPETASPSTLASLPVPGPVSVNNCPLREQLGKNDDCAFTLQCNSAPPSPHSPFLFVSDL